MRFVRSFERSTPFDRVLDRVDRRVRGCGWSGHSWYGLAVMLGASLWLGSVMIPYVVGRWFFRGLWRRDAP